MKKYLMITLSLLLVFIIAGCTTGKEKDSTGTTSPKCDVCEPEIVEVEVEVEVEKDLTPSPEVLPLVYHWVPDALTAEVTAKLDLKLAEEDTLMIAMSGRLLKDYIDYEIFDGTLTIFGQTLHNAKLGLGKHPVHIITEHGATQYMIEVVKDVREASSIETTTTKGIDMMTVDSFQPTEIIADAPELMITEVGVDMYEYSYIEVFNNTTETYNLKNHRIVYSDLTKQTMIEQELFEQPYGMAIGAFIYEDYEIPALSTAVIWIVGSFPWEQQEGKLMNGSNGRIMVEDAGADVHLFGSKPENLSIQKFRDVYQLDEEVLVFPVRPQASLMNSTSSFTEEGFGVALPKGAVNRFSSFNSKMADRGVQIQKFDLDKKIPVTDMAGVSYYKYDVGVLNREEDIYSNGSFDRTKFVIYGGREAINIFYGRKAFYNDQDEIVSYAYGAKAIDTYNANNGAYLQMYRDIVTPLSTALIYGNYVDEGGSLTLKNWGGHHGLEYTIPATPGSTLMRYIPMLGTHENYKTELAKEASGQLKLLGLAEEVAEIHNNSDIIVPVSNIYPTDYLSTGYNTIGRGINANFVKKTKE